MANGMVLICKVLEQDSFAWPKVQDGVMRLSGAQFAALFEGLDWRRMDTPKVPRPKVAEPRRVSWRQFCLSQAAIA